MIDSKWTSKKKPAQTMYKNALQTTPPPHRQLLVTNLARKKKRCLVPKKQYIGFQYFPIIKKVKS